MSGRPRTFVLTSIPEPHEIVPQALRGRLRWDARHDREAAKIMAEGGLVLPRDRELIRQLAFVRVAQPNRRSKDETDLCGLAQVRIESPGEG